MTPAWGQLPYSDYLLLTTHYLLLTTHYSLLTTYYLLLATCYLLLATCYLLLTTCYLLLATCYLLLAHRDRELDDVAELEVELSHPQVGEVGEGDLVVGSK